MTNLMSHSQFYGIKYSYLYMLPYGKSLMTKSTYEENMTSKILINFLQGDAHANFSNGKCTR